MPKRKAAAAEVPEHELRRSTRRKSGAVAPPQQSAPAATTASTKKAAKATTAKAKRAADDDEPLVVGGQKPTKSRKTSATTTEGNKASTSGASFDGKDSLSPSPSTSPSSSLVSQTQRLTIEKEAGGKSNVKAKQPANASAKKSDTNGASNTDKSYWLLKAEPETRLENGTDVRFSIDDLAAKTEPEPWDGIRNYVARNNLRAMKKGDLAFFYHSNCKEPGIVGTMEIVQEHSPDLSAHDPKAPYYDASSKAADPKWSVVHVEFRSKFKEQIGLKELREMGKMGSALENMQLLKQSRLSVSRVSPDEWTYLMGIVDERGGTSKTA